MSSLAAVVGTRAASRAGLYAVLIAFAAFYLTPMAMVVLNSFRPLEEITRSSVLGLPESLQLVNWRQAWSGYCIAGRCEGIRPYMGNSMLIAVPATLLSTIWGAFAGYALSLWRFRYHALIFGIITLGIFLPPQVKLVPWTIVLRELGLNNSITGLVLIHTIQGTCFTILFCRNYYLAVPDEIIKAAQIDGAGLLRIFRRIILPISPPILIVCVIWQFTQIWNEYLFGVTFSSDDSQPVTAALMAFSANIAQAREIGIESAAVLIAALPTLLIYLFGGRYFMRGLTAGAVK